MIHARLKLDREAQTLERLKLATIDAEQRMLEEAGEQVAEAARASIRRGSPGQTSLEGQPPVTWTGDYPASIEASWDKKTRSMIVGARAQAAVGGTPVPELLEHGGVQMTKNRRGEDVAAHYRARPAMRLALVAAIRDRKVARAIENSLRTS